MYNFSIGLGMFPTTLLIVDDNPVWLRAISAYFSFSGFSVRTAASCAAALKSAAELRPDCLLLDFHLTDGDGGSVCDKLRSDMSLKRTPIIMISADPLQELPAYTEYKADGFILKGTPFVKMQAMMECMLRRINWERGILLKGDLRLEQESLQVFRGRVPVAVLSDEQFDLLFLLVDRSPKFLSEENISAYVMDSKTEIKSEAVRALLHRLRQRLGTQLGRRIKNKRRLGWIYVQPRAKSSSSTK